MGDGDDFNTLVKNPVDEVERKLHQNEPPLATASSRVALWILRDPLNGVLDFADECRCGSAASLEVPVRCGQKLCSRRGMELNDCHRVARGVARVPDPRGWS